jgi:hypothetical protein
MDQKVEGLVNDCILLQHEIGLLTPIILFLSPSSNIERIRETHIPKSAGLKIKEKLEQSRSPVKIKAEYILRIKELKNKLADLAEQLEGEEFELEKFRSQVSEDQFDWLVSHKKEIKKHLRGIELR